jgi:phenylalanyl-tRNA synthetase beta chain
LRQVGVRPINNVVDATNYVLMAVGHPLHAFDLDRVAGKQIIVRAAEDGEKFTTLDSVTRTMPDKTVMICDADGPVGVAGIMGGENSEIRTTTTSVLLEAAYFNPARIRRASKALGLSTEASQRFERGTDYENTVRAIDWCAELIRQTAGGTIARGRIDRYPTTQTRADITLRWNQIPRILGTDVPRDEVRRQVTALGIELLAEDESGLRLRQPSWRPDLTREIDVIEEVARLWGYDRIPTTLGGVGAPATRETPERLTINDARRWLVGMGLQEVVTSALVSRQHAELFLTDGSPVQLANWSSSDMSHLRTHMLPSLLEVARRNFAHKSAPGISVFEIGAEYRERDSEYTETRQIAILLTGKTPGERWGDADRQWDWYDLRGVIEQIIERCALLEPHFVSYDLNGYVQRTGVRIRIADDEVGELGQVVPALCSEFDLTYPVFFARLDLAALAAHRRSLQTITPLPRFPAVERDLALVVPETVSAGTVEEVVREAGGALLERFVLFDVYRGAGLREGEKSLGFTMEFRASDRTLTDQEVDGLVHGMVKAAEAKTGARVRT